MTTKPPFRLKRGFCSIWGTLVEYIYDYFSTNIIYWEALLVRREKVMRNGTKGPSYDFLTMALER